MPIDQRSHGSDIEMASMRHRALLELWKRASFVLHMPYISPELMRESY